MEKIQSAIEKARTARAAVAGLQPQAGQVPPVRGPEPAKSAATAWAALSPYTANAAQLRKNRVMTLTGDAVASPFDMMRTKILQQMRANNWRRLAITSPSAGCGKSTLTLNLAFSLSRQRELRIVLGELDLRRPSLGRLLGITGRPSFSLALDGKADFAEVALRHQDGLALAVNANVAGNPAELLHGSTVARVLTEIEARYEPDMMLFDMPPMLVSDDVMAFTTHVDAVLLIAAAETTTVKEIDLCERELAAQTNVMGVVLNKCHFMGKEYSSDYFG
ncbi:MAG: CpsD/CapB family tyrosine-protein kinase [Candidatus Saccharibacteria bacterium]|nr:CpsD/CapB family tyrosine-protein kinase [Pseudorhodobacter sp.]